MQKEAKFVRLMRPIVLGLLDRYATVENMQYAVENDVDLGLLLASNWDKLESFGINRWLLKFSLSRVSKESQDKVNKYRVMTWLEEERPHIVKLIDSTPGAFDWLGRNVDRVKAVLPMPHYNQPQ